MGFFPGPSKAFQNSKHGNCPIKIASISLPALGFIFFLGSSKAFPNSKHYFYYENLIVHHITL